MCHAPFSDVLEALDDTGGRGASLPLGEVIERTGSRVHGAAILLLALPEAIPIPVPSLSGILGVPLVAVSAHLALYGERGRLPERVLRQPVPGRVLSLLARRVAGPVRRVERVSRPRLPHVIERERMLGAVCLALSLLLLLPIPFLNAAPAIALVLVAWGLVQRDGAFAAAGLAAAAGTALLVGLMFEAIASLLGALAGAGQEAVHG